MKKTAFVYVDAFNLYYRSLRGTAYKWLDLGKLCDLLLSSYKVKTIRYFTAIIDPRPDDPQQQQRQQVYLRALRTDPRITIHYGLFMTNPVRLPYANPRP